MSDLNKLMEKMNNNKKPIEKQTKKPVEKPIEQPVADVPQPTEEINDDTDTEDVEKIPAQQVDQNSIEQEVGVLQNVGIYRREMILVEKEKVDVFKVIAQTLLDIRKKLLGEEDAK